MSTCLGSSILPSSLQCEPQSFLLLKTNRVTWVLPGQTVKLSCALNPGYNIREFGVAWYQQRPGSPPRYLLYYNSEVDKDKPSEIPDRFSASKDLASNACVLTIAGVQAEDHADYYCSVSYPIYYL
uniref:Ig-like domain-containing protein n=1 Tax=Gopherus agassizii TaxID=38772 RepID=A0A452J7M6_9SAUR